MTSIDYEADGQTRRIAYANGAVTTFSYSPERRWLTRLRTALASGRLLFDTAYARDARGRIVAIDGIQDGEDWAYAYDGFDRLANIVPQQLATHPALALTGFDIAGYANKMALPGKAGLHRSRTVHSGMHRKEYSKRMESVLDGVAARVRSGELTPAQGRAVIENAIARERKGLRTGETSLNKASDAAKGKSADKADKSGKGERDDRNND